MIYWPETLPDFPQLSGFSEVFEDNTIRFETATGPGKARPRFTNPLHIKEIPIRVDSIQRNTFEGFYFGTLDNGTLEFYWVDPINRVEYIFLFNDEPMITPIGNGNYIVTMKLSSLLQLME